MDTRNCVRCVSAPALLIAAISIAAGVGSAAPQNDRVATKRLANVPPIPPQQKQKILQMKHVKHDPTGQVHVYGLLHPIDRLGWLDLHQADVLFESHNASVATNTGSVTLTFNPIAVNKPHLLIFSVAVGDGPVTVQINQTDAAGSMQPTATQTASVQNGRGAYVPVIITPLANSYVNVTISNASSANKAFTFERVSLELVK